MKRVNFLDHEGMADVGFTGQRWQEPGWGWRCWFGKNVDWKTGNDNNPFMAVRFSKEAALLSACMIALEGVPPRGDELDYALHEVEGLD